MSLTPCPFEPRVLTAMAARADDRNDPEAATHLAGCPSCREALHLATELAALARRSLPPPRALPTASELYWRAEIARRLAAEATPPVPSRRRVLLGAAGAALAVVVCALVPAGLLAGLPATVDAAGLAARILLFAVAVGAPAVLAWSAFGLLGEEI
jgi:predicted anti-sigma-YlaC factor YlaD